MATYIIENRNGYNYQYGTQAKTCTPVYIADDGFELSAMHIIAKGHRISGVTAKFGYMEEGNHQE